MNKLLTDNIKKQYLKYVVPSVAGSLAYGILIFIDTVFIGRGIGTAGIAALNISLPIYSLTAFGMVLGIGGATSSAIALGRGDLKERDSFFTISVTLGIFISLMFSIISTFFLDEITNFLGAKGDIFFLTREYISVLSKSIIFYILPHILNNFIKNDNHPKLSMYFFLLVTITNIILDYIFIFIFKWGMGGAAFATSISQFLGTLVLFSHFFRKSCTLKFNLKYFNFSLIPKIVNVGLSNFITEITLGIVLIFSNHQFYKYFGNNGVSSYGILYNINLIIYLVSIGIAEGAQPLISVNFGANKIHRIKETLNIGLRVTSTTSIFLYSILIIFKKPIVTLFNGEDFDVINITLKALPIFFTSVFLMGINLKLTAFFQAIGSSKLANILTFLRGFVYIIFFIYLLPTLWGGASIWLAWCFSEVLTLGTAFYFYKAFYKNKL